METNYAAFITSDTTEQLAISYIKEHYEIVGNFKKAIELSVLQAEKIRSILNQVHNSLHTYEFNKSYTYGYWTDVIDYLNNIELNHEFYKKI